MGYDKALAERIRRRLARRKHVEEKKMFGGIGFVELKPVDYPLPWSTGKAFQWVVCERWPSDCCTRRRTDDRI